MRRWAMVCVAAGLIGGTIAAQQPAKDAFRLTAQEEQILKLTNEARTKEKLPPLKPNPLLFQVARSYSAVMARHQKCEHFLEGTKPNERVKAAGYRYHHTGENLAWGQNLAIAEVFEGWMKSPKHRENILRKEFSEIGLGCAVDKDGATYYTQVFASPQKQR